MEAEVGSRWPMSHKPSGMSSAQDWAGRRRRDRWSHASPPSRPSVACSAVRGCRRVDAAVVVGTTLSAGAASPVSVRRRDPWAAVGRRASLRDVAAGVRGIREPIAVTVRQRRADLGESHGGVLLTLRRPPESDRPEKALHRRQRRPAGSVRRRSGFVALSAWLDRREHERRSRRNGRSRPSTCHRERVPVGASLCRQSSRRCRRPGRRRRRDGAEVREVRARLVVVRSADAEDVVQAYAHGYWERGSLLSPLLSAAVTGGHHEQRVGVPAIVSNSLGLNPRAAEAGIDDADALLAGPVEGLDTVARRPGTFPSSTRSGITRASGATLRYRRRSVANRRNRSRDVRAVPVLVLRVGVVFDPVVARRHLPDEVGMCGIDAGVDDCDGATGARC